MHLRALAPAPRAASPLVISDSEDGAAQPAIDNGPAPAAAEPADAIQLAVAHANGTCGADCEWCRLAVLAAECAQWRAKAAQAPTGHELLGGPAAVGPRGTATEAPVSLSYAPPPSPVPPSPPAGPVRGLPMPAGAGEQ